MLVSQELSVCDVIAKYGLYPPSVSHPNVSVNGFSYCVPHSYSHYTFHQKSLADPPLYHLSNININMHTHIDNKQ